MKEEEKARFEATRNQGREERILMAVVVNTRKRKEASMRLANRDGEDSDLKMRNLERAVEATGLEASQYAIIDR